jgi:hypothetical protein
MWRIEMNKFFQHLLNQIKHTQSFLLGIMIVWVIFMQQSSSLEEVKSKILTLEGIILGWLFFNLMLAVFLCKVKRK